MRLLKTAMIASAAFLLFGQAETTLQRGIRKETLEGDLKGAIELYRKAIGQAGKDRVTAAQALVHIGACYEKLGDAEARKAYERVVREFADQAESVTAANARLAMLRSESVRATGVTVKQIWSGPELGSFTPGGWTVPVGISPDGRYLTHADFGGEGNGNLMLRDLSNGQERIVVRNNSPERVGAEGSVFSPDGTQIAYCWQNHFRDHYEPTTNEDLRIVKADGAGMRILYSGDIGHLDPVAWSPDQKHILIYTEPNRTEDSEFVLISVADGSRRPLRVGAPWFASWRHASFSPDGRYIAYDRADSPTAPQRDVFVISVYTGVETPVVQHPADEYALGWAPDGSGVLFVSDRTASGPAIWFQPVSQGKPSGEPRFVRQITGRMAPVGWTHNGSLFYKLSSPMFDIYAVSLDSVTGKVAGSPTPVSTGTVGGSSAAVWSPDGRSLAYRAAPSKLMIRSTADGSQRAIDIHNTDWAPESWTADGRSIIVDSSQGILQVDAVTGAVSVSVPFDKLKRPEHWHTWHIRTARLRGETLFWSDGPRIFTGNIRIWDTKTLLGPGSTNGIGKNFDASVDGRQIAYAWERSLRITAASGETREIHQLQEGETWVSGWDESGVWGSVHFTPDGRYVLFAKTKNGVSSIWRVPATGGDAVSLGITGERLVDFTISPDGKQLVFGDYKRLYPELWVMENFLATLAQTGR